MELVEVNLCVLEEEEWIDDSGRIIQKGMQHLSGYFLEKDK